MKTSKNKKDGEKNVKRKKRNIPGNEMIKERERK